jgi:hypothetical protein
MSDLLPAPLQKVLYGNWTPAWFRPHHPSIGGIVAEVTIEEQEVDDITVTEHPVEQGAPIADHAFKRPSSVTIHAGWSMTHAGDLSAESGVYGLLLSWQASLMPFDLLTTKRSYSNMLIERLVVMTEQSTRFALMAQITCKQIFIVGTQTTEVAGMSTDSNNHQQNGLTTRGAADRREETTASNGPTTPQDIESGGIQAQPVTQGQEPNIENGFNGQVISGGNNVEPPNNPTLDMNGRPERQVSSETVSTIEEHQ